MDGLAERAGLGKGTVFRRSPPRAGIFQALLATMSGPSSAGCCPDRHHWAQASPLWPRLTAYGPARTGFLIRHRKIARAALDGSQPIPAGPRTPISHIHIRMLLGQLSPSTT
jgi:hypothetical protein